MAATYRKTYRCYYRKRIRLNSIQTMSLIRNRPGSLDSTIFLFPLVLILNRRKCRLLLFRRFFRKTRHVFERLRHKEIRLKIFRLTFQTTFIFYFWRSSSNLIV